VGNGGGCSAGIEISEVIQTLVPLCCVGMCAFRYLGFGRGLSFVSSKTITERNGVVFGVA
jgi:hypothetical protein